MTRKSRYKIFTLKNPNHLIILNHIALIYLQIENTARFVWLWIKKYYIIKVYTIVFGFSICKSFITILRRTMNVDQMTVIVKPFCT